MLRKMVLVLLVGMVLVATAPAAGQRYALEVKGLACPFCAYGIEKRLLAMDGVDSIRVDIEKGRVVVTAKEDATLSEERVRKAISRAGFTLDGFHELEPTGQRDE